jgi:hypothetical protein
MSNIFGLSYNDSESISYMSSLVSVHSDWRKFLFLGMSFQQKVLHVTQVKFKKYSIGIFQSR